MSAPPSTIAEWFKGKTLAELDIIEHAGRQLYPDALKHKRLKDGVILEKPVYLRTPSMGDTGLARGDCLEWVRKLRRIDGPIDVDRATAAVGATVFENMDTVCLLARCTRTREPPYPQYLVAELLDAQYPMATIYELFDRLDFYMRMEDPRVSELSEDMFFAAVENIARVRNTSPLVAIGGLERDSFITTMAVRLQSFRTLKSSLPSTEISTLEHSNGAT